MLDGHPLAQLRPSLRRELALAQLLEELFVGMDVDAPSGGAGGAALAQGADLALVLWEVHGGARAEGDHHLVGAANGAGRPIEREGGLGIAVAVADRPGLAIPRQVGGAVA